MSTNLKHIGGYTYKLLKGKNFDEIQKLFDKEMKGKKKMLGRKRAGKEQQQESSKKQIMKEDKESEEVKEDDEGEIKKHLVIKKDEDIAIDAYTTCYPKKMLQGIDREDLESLWRIVKIKYSDIRPEDEFERVLWGDLKIIRNLKIQKMNIKFRGGLLGLKRLHGFLEVTAAQVHNGNYAKCAAGGKITTV
ncbi:hypothetical protein Tco_1313317 [Tanacetum coccineum]